MGHERASLAMIRRAIRNRWPISAETRERARQEVMKILAESDSDRAKLGAIKALIEMDKVNLAATNLDVQAEKIEAGKPEMALTVVDAMKAVDAAERAMGPTKEA